MAFEGSRDDVINLMKILKQNSAVNDVRVLSEGDTRDKGKINIIKIMLLFTIIVIVIIIGLIVDIILDIFIIVKIY